MSALRDITMKVNNRVEAKLTTQLQTKRPDEAVEIEINNDHLIIISTVDEDIMAFYDEEERGICSREFNLLNFAEAAHEKR